MLTLRSPAKVNLFLRILRRRPDGFHEIASLFQAISLFDTIHIKHSSIDRLSCDRSLPMDESNLVTKALRLFRQKTGLNSNVEVFLEKRIPMEAGLGGGSSNAATTLFALNELYGRPATTVQLAGWGAEIGSDVPFFLSLGTAYCTGRGEQLRHLAPLPVSTLHIVKPQQGLPTKLVYQRLRADKLPNRDPEMTLQGFHQGNAHYYNDLEEPAFSLMPSLARLKTQLRASGYAEAILSGSGTSFFCLGEGTPPADCEHYVAHPVNRGSASWY